MCIRPIMLPNGVETACHECWQCVEQSVNDWVGRCIAESKTASQTWAVTLTYGRSRAGDVDHERAVILTYSDVQKFLKLLRRHGYAVRYFVTGEFGSLKGRSHWHIVLFFEGGFPPLAGVLQGSGRWSDHALDVRFLWHRVDDKGEPVMVDGKPALWWPHGWSHVTPPNAANIRYNCKYIQKDIGDAERQGHLSMSKKPPLGAVYFRELAERYVRQGLAPQSLAYSFPEVRRQKADGSEEVVPFMLKDRSAELFLEHYVNTWRAVHPGRHLPASELVEEFTDPGAWSARGEADRVLDRDYRAKVPDVPKPGIQDLWSWMRRRDVRWDSEARVWRCPSSRGLYEWRFIPRKGAFGWRLVDGN